MHATEVAGRGILRPPGVCHERTLSGVGGRNGEEGHPPEKSMIAPVRKLVARNRISSPISSGRPSRFAGTEASTTKLGQSREKPSE
jgi:hypothetical protein